MKPAPTEAPKTPRACYEYLSEQDAYEGENQSDYDSRMALLDNFKMQVLALGVSIEEHLQNQERKIVLPTTRKLKMGQK
jgi:hypothetical protein